MTNFFRVIHSRSYGLPEGPVSVREGDVLSELDPKYVALPKEIFAFDHVDGVGELRNDIVEVEKEEPVVYEVKDEVIVKKPRKPRKAVV